MVVVERRLKDNKKESYFLQYAKNIKSQGGEDGILEKLFSHIGTSSTPFCVDVGAWDGIHLSNTFNLLHEKLWSGVLFEADVLRSERLKELYAERMDITSITELVEIDGSKSLPSLLTSLNTPKDFDFLSIDIDGADYHIWKSLHTIFQPRVVCVEFNPTIPNHVLFIQDADTKIHQGSSLLALIELGKSLGYTLIATTTFNAIFILDSLFHLLPEGKYDIDSLHSSSMITDIFQTYDGELKLCGPRKLIWHKLSLNIQQIQVLKPKDRIFPFAPTSYKDLEHLYNLYKKYAENLKLIIQKSRIIFMKDVYISWSSLLEHASNLIKRPHLVGIVDEIICKSFLVINTVNTATIQRKNRSTVTTLEYSRRMSTIFENLADSSIQQHNREKAIEWLKKSLYVCASVWDSDSTSTSASTSASTQDMNHLQHKLRLALKLSRLYQNDEEDLAESLFWIQYAKDLNYRIEQEYKCQSTSNKFMKNNNKQISATKEVEDDDDDDDDDEANRDSIASSINKELLRWKKKTLNIVELYTNSYSTTVAQKDNASTGIDWSEMKEDDFNKNKIENWNRTSSSHSHIRCSDRHMFSKYYSLMNRILVPGVCIMTITTITIGIFTQRTFIVSLFARNRK